MKFYMLIFRILSGIGGMTGIAFILWLGFFPDGGHLPIYTYLVLFILLSLSILIVLTSIFSLTFLKDYSKIFIETKRIKKELIIKKLRDELTENST